MTRALIIEDEQPAALRLQKLIEGLRDDIKIVAQLDSVSSTVEWLGEHEMPDLLFLDIQLADGLSFEIFKQINITSSIIFTTAYDQYAVRAFEHNSIDYLLKPINEEKLERSLDKFTNLQVPKQTLDIDKIIAFMAQEKKEYKKRFLINMGSKIKSINTEDILLFYVLEKSTFISTIDNRSYPIDYSLDRVEEMINEDDFFRINRQTIVNHRGIDKISVYSKSRIKLEIKPQSDIELLVSSKKSHAFRLWLDK